MEKAVKKNVFDKLLVVPLKTYCHFAEATPLLLVNDNEDRMN